MSYLHLITGPVADGRCATVPSGGRCTHKVERAWHVGVMNTRRGHHGVQQEKWCSGMILYQANTLLT